MTQAASRPAATAEADRPRTDGRLAEVARGGLLNLAGAAVAGLGTVALTLIITRSFSEAAAGAFFTAMSLFLIIEAVTQLRGAAGARQRPNCNVGLCHGNGVTLSSQVTALLGTAATL